MTNQRRKIIVGNWKMNNGPHDAHAFMHELQHAVEGKHIHLDWAIAAPFLSMPFLLPHSHGHEAPFIIPLAAQNFHQAEKGAFTGETSLKMLEELGTVYAIVGHSERRQYFNETDHTVNLKLHAASKSSITPIFAYGETLEQNEQGKTHSVIKHQLTEGLKGLTPEYVSKIVLAYEPIWAIGTGKTATPQQAQDACHYSRKIIEELFGHDTASKIRIQYGGSVNTANVAELMAQPDIDGALVGGASVKAEDFAKLITYK